MSCGVTFQGASVSERKSSFNPPPGELLRKHYTDAVLVMIGARESMYEFWGVCVNVDDGWCSVVFPLFDTDYRDV